MGLLGAHPDMEKFAGLRQQNIQRTLSHPGKDQCVDVCVGTHTCNPAM